MRLITSLLTMSFIESRSCWMRLSIIRRRSCFLLQQTSFAVSWWFLMTTTWFRKILFFSFHFSSEINKFRVRNYFWALEFFFTLRFLTEKSKTMNVSIKDTTFFCSDKTNEFQRLPVTVKTTLALPNWSTKSFFFIPANTFKFGCNEQLWTSHICSL